MKNRIYKMLLATIMVPFLLIVLIATACIVPLLPIIALFKPQLINFEDYKK